ncbi:type I DNA topoisomerase [Pseudobdellovibrio sp. HCB154]|uniref:type I DNA topoisomerase n=1 Tax=Pseudobdellovibrio sp. HCB154 TaxID=3386277 RepID=UPI0039173B89
MAKKAAAASSASSSDSLGSGTKLVIVESPTKAKTIRKFLGKDFIVESCMGHVRDLPQSSKDIPEKVKKEKWAQLGVNVDKNFEPLYCIPKDKTKVIKNLKDKLEEADVLYLATDEDREGESISWHLQEVLKPRIPTKRMVFHEITKEAIQKSLSQTREIDYNLVRAQEARRILDRLVGYTISPLLWKKVAYGLSAGRVQSVAVRLIVEREKERIRFKKSNYYGLTAYLDKGGESFEAKLLTVDQKRVATGKDFDGLTGQLNAGKDLLVLDSKTAQSLASKVQAAQWKVTEVEEKPVHRKPYAPFITSTLQQEANRKLGMSSRETMQVAQKLYEQGFITYMRTDSTSLSQEAIQAARTAISEKYGKEYLPAQPRLYDNKKVKGAQEAHECIRPAGTHFQDPDDTGLTGPQAKLYELIWKRTMASQMTDSRQKQVSAKLSADNTIFNATGTTIEFPGFLRAYVEGSDDPEADLESREVRLPQLKQNDSVKPQKMEPTAHETKPPARFTEASLVQTMEKEGIGRPSTYASVIGTIIDRGYVKKMGNALIPTFTAMVVSKLLANHLTQYVDLGFTSEMENSLDEIADGELDWESYLASVYHGKKGLRSLVAEEEGNINPEEARTIKLDGLDKYEFHVGKYGAYVKTQRGEESFSASIPDAEAPADVTSDTIEKLIEQKIKGADSLGVDPKTGKKIYVLNGRYGAYVQLGENDDEEIKRSTLPPGMDPTAVNYEMALEILALPKSLGTNPGNGKDIKAGVGRFGPYVVCDGDYRSIPKTESVFTMNLEKALALFAIPKKGRGKAAALKEFGKHPQFDIEVSLFNGPYGPYLKAGKTNVGLPEGVTADTITKEKAFELMNEKLAEAGTKGKKGAKKATKTLKKAAKPAEKAEALGVKKVITKKKK